MSQRLTLPLTKTFVTASYKVPEYKRYFGWDHYGYDLTSTSREVLACGDGTVVAAGQDGVTQTGANSRLGNVLVIVYKDVLCNDGVVRNLSCRMYHLASISVKVGEEVKRGDVVAIYGNTGANTTGAHLHIEFDSDTNFPTLAYGVSVGGNVINRRDDYQKAGGLADSTVDPDKIWFSGEGQSIQAASVSWSDIDDVTIPSIPQDTPDYKFLYEETLKKYNEANLKLDAIRKAGGWN